MRYTENPGDRISIVQINSELRHAQLELISAHCATHKLRVRFSIEDLARYGRRDVLRKSIEMASAMSEYYSAIEAQFLAKKRSPRPLEPWMKNLLCKEFNTFRLTFETSAIDTCHRPLR